MHLDNGMIEGIQRVQDCDGRMRKGARIDGDAARGLARCVDPVDDFVLAVALMEVDLQLQFFSQRAAIALDIGQRFAPVNFRLAFAEQVEIWSVQYIDETTHRTLQRVGKYW